MGWTLRHAGRTDVGQQREVNEDAYCVLPRFGLYIVADGMGGHRAGDVASKLATDSISQFFNDTEGEDATWPFHFDPTRTYEENRLVAGIKLANRRIYEASSGNAEVRGMGTTVVGCVFAPAAGRVYIGHVGDSRCYRVRGGEITQLTRDHSLVNDYRVAMPHLTDEQMAGLPRNVITRALGMQESVVVDVLTDEPEEGDVYLLCTDGLSEAVTEEQLLGEVANLGGELDGVTGRLIEAANASGGDDNITVVLVAVDAAEGAEEAEAVSSAAARVAGGRRKERVPPTRSFPDPSEELTAEYDAAGDDDE